MTNAWRTLPGDWGRLFDFGRVDAEVKRLADATLRHWRPIDRPCCKRVLMSRMLLRPSPNLISSSKC